MGFRSKLATLLRLIVAPFLFILLTFVVDKALSADTTSRLYYNDTGNGTTPVPVTAIPACETELYGKRPCWDFFYTPNTDAIAQVQPLPHESCLLCT